MVTMIQNERVNTYSRHLAFDLGASNARLMAGKLEQGQLQLKELSRLDHSAFIDSASGKLLWELPKITKWMESSLCESTTKNTKYQSLGIDTWGVDYALLDDSNQLLSPVICYRDTATQGIYEQINKIIEAEDLYQATGAQFMEANTLCQLVVQQQNEPQLLQQCKFLLMLPSYLAYLLCGVQANEPTQASTSQLFDIKNKEWNTALITKIGLPSKIFGPLQSPGNILAEHLLPHITQKNPNLAKCKVVQVATHDTASAVLAIPFQNEDAKLFLSSGTWSVMGIETDTPILSAQARAKNFANELAFDGNIRFLRSLTGLWLLQELRRNLAKEGQDYSFAELAEMAQQEKPYRFLIPVGHPNLLHVGHIGEKLSALCSQSRQGKPLGLGEIVRCIYDSLALEYRCCNEDIATLSGHKTTMLHIVGGGAKDILLNQLCADCLEMPVHTGPLEAAAIGNILAQLISSGACKSQAEARYLVQKSFPCRSFQPDVKQTEYIREAFSRYQNIKESFQ